MKHLGKLLLTFLFIVGGFSPGWAGAPVALKVDNNLPTPIFTFDPANGPTATRGKTPGSAVRASAAAFYRSSTGMYALYPNDTLLYDPGLQAVLLEGGATNIVTAAKTNPTTLANVYSGAVAVAVVNDATSLTASGIGVFGPNAYLLDNSARGSADTVGLGGNNSTTNPHSLSVFVRGSGTVRISLSNNNPSPWHTLTSTYKRIKLEGYVPTGTGQNTILEVGAGTKLYFVQPDVVAGPLCTSPIPGGTGAITRASAGADISGNGLSTPLSQAMIDSLVGERVDWSTAGTFGNSGADSSYITVTLAEKKLVFAGTYASAWWAKSGQSGVTYEVSYSITGRTQGQFKLATAINGQTRNSDGTYIERIASSGAGSLYFYGLNNFNGTVAVNYVRRVLESGQTNPGEGTIIQWVGLPWDSSVIPNSTTIGIISSNNVAFGIQTIYRGISGTMYIRSTDAINSASAITEFAAGRYCLISQWSASLGKMRAGFYNPTTDTLTWSHATLAGGSTYRGFYPIHSSNRLRWFYGGGNYPIYIGKTLWYNYIVPDVRLHPILRKSTQQ